MVGEGIDDGCDVGSAGFDGPTSSSEGPDVELHSGFGGRLSWTVAFENFGYDLGVAEFGKRLCEGVNLGITDY